MFFLGTNSASAASRPITSGSLIFSDTISSYTGTEDDSAPAGLTPSQAISNTYSFPATSTPHGRGTLDGNGNTVAYIISSTVSSAKLVFFDKTAAKPSLTIVEK
jgi:hypothetical protein